MLGQDHTDMGLPGSRIHMILKTDHHDSKTQQKKDCTDMKGKFR